jgi:hypothetical protein
MGPFHPPCDFFVCICHGHKFQADIPISKLRIFLFRNFPYCVRLKSECPCQNDGKYLTSQNNRNILKKDFTNC